MSEAAEWCAIRRDDYDDKRDTASTLSMRTMVVSTLAASTIASRRVDVDEEDGGYHPAGKNDSE